MLESGEARGCVERIADVLLESAIVDEGQATWAGPTLEWSDGRLAAVHRTGDPTLYDGSAGIALACWSIGGVLHREDLLELAVAAARHALAGSGRVSRPGLYDGRAGIALAGLRVGLGCGARELTAAATAILEGLEERRVERSDVIGGAAGITLAFVRAAELTGDERWLRAARAAAETLVRRADRRPWGWAWPNDADDPGLCGLAHGVAGAIWALAETARVSGEPGRFEDAIRGGRQFERSWFDPRSNRWPDLRPDPSGPAESKLAWPTLWCHGSVGIGVSRLAVDACRPHPAVKAEVAAALQSSCADGVESVERASLDHGLTLCHGLAGTVDFLIDAHFQFGQDAHLRTARWLAGKAVATLGEAPEAWPGGVRGSAGPGLMNGLAGTMVVLGRVEDPGAVPSTVRLGYGGGEGNRSIALESGAAY